MGKKNITDNKLTKLQDFHPGKEFLRREQVDITQYIPEFLRKDFELKACADIESLEHDNIRKSIQDIFKQFYIGTATWGLELWERVLDLHPDELATVEYRRAQILVRLRGLKISTKAVMEDIVNTYGAGYIEEHNDRYFFNVYVAVPDAAAYKALRSDIITFRPAHLGLNVYLGYSWNGNIKFDGSHTFGSHNEDWSDVSI